MNAKKLAIDLFFLKTILLYHRNYDNIYIINE